MKMENKEEIKRIDGKYYLVRELETDGEPVKINGEMVQPIKSIKSIDDDCDCHHCCMYDIYNCGEICVGRFFVRVLPENSKETKLSYEELEHFYNSKVGLWAIDRNPYDVGLDWIRENAFQLRNDLKYPNPENIRNCLEPEKEETTMERKIGEIFEYNGEWYQCVEGTGCYQCAFYHDENICTAGNLRCTCRSDKKDVIFKKLEKVGEPYKLDGVLIQQYQGLAPVVLPKDSERSNIFKVISTINVIGIKIKQNEDMEKPNSELSNIEKIGENLKPFNLEAAKAGKPICTRDGRKARIICFDRVTNSTNKYTGHLIVLVTNPNGDEQSFYYTEKGNLAGEDEYDNHKWDLMMLTVRKEGWVNIYKSDNDSFPALLGSAYVYNTKERALANAAPDTTIDTIKISWEE